MTVSKTTPTRTVAGKSRSSGSRHAAPKTSKSTLKRAQIRQAAYLCFRDHGYHDTSVDQICDAAGISKGSFYWHYAAKQDVFVDILETWTRQIMDELYEQFEDAVLADDYADALTRALQREIHRGRVIVPLWLEFTVHATRETEIREALAKFYRRARTAIAEMLRPALLNRCTDEEIRGIAACVFGAYAGLIIQDLSDPERADASVSVRCLMDVFGKSFATSATSAAP
jgi:AcrR family transcriptional regulator